MKKLLILNLLFALIAINISAWELTKDPTFKTSQQVDNIVNYMYFDGIDTKNVLTVYTAGGAPITIDTTDLKINEIIDSLAVLINKHDTITTADTINIINYAIDTNFDTQLTVLLQKLFDIQAEIKDKHDTLTITNDTVNISNYNIDSNIDTEISLLLVELIKLNSKHDTLTAENDTVNIANAILFSDSTVNIINFDTELSLLLSELQNISSKSDTINFNIILADSISFVDTYIAGDTRISEIIIEKINNETGAVVRTIRNEIIYDSVSGRMQAIIWKP